MKTNIYTVQGLLSDTVSVKQNTIQAKTSTEAIKLFLAKYPNIDFINAKARLQTSNSIIQTKLFTDG